MPDVRDPVIVVWERVRIEAVVGESGEEQIVVAQSQIIAPVFEIVRVLERDGEAIECAERPFETVRLNAAVPEQRMGGQDTVGGLLRRNGLEGAFASVSGCGDTVNSPWVEIAKGTSRCGAPEISENFQAFPTNEAGEGTIRIVEEFLPVFVAIGDECVDDEAEVGEHRFVDRCSRSRGNGSRL